MTGPMGTGSTQFVAPSPVHSGGSNFLALDGHVKWLHGSQVSDGDTAYHPTDQQTTNNTAATGTSSMLLPTGAQATLTFSPN